MSQNQQITRERRRVGAYTRRVRVMRFLLPIAALAMLAVVFYFSAPARNVAETVLQGGKVAAVHAGMRLTNPSYSGQTASGEPFIIHAAWAQPDGPDPNEIELSQITAELTMSDGRIASVEAGAGRLLPQVNKVLLNDGVRLFTSDGYEIKTQTLRADAKARTIESGGSIQGEGPAGKIRAGKMRVQQSDGGVLLFENGVEMTITQLVESRATGQ